MGTKSSYRKGGTEFQREWSRQEKLFREAGMADDAIEEIRRFDLKAFRSEKRFGRHICSFFGFSDENRGKEENNPFLKRNIENLTTWMDIGSFTADRYWWVEELACEWLAGALKALSGEDLEFVTILVKDELSQKEIAARYGKSECWVVWKKRSIRRKLEAAKRPDEHTEGRAVSQPK